jgi:hypothetical protein
MIATEPVQTYWPLGAPTPLHTLKEQVTLVKGWTQLVTRYPVEEWPQHEPDIAKALARIDTACRHISELLALDTSTDN